MAVPQDVGTLVDLEFSLPDDVAGSLRIQGVVVSADSDRAGMGIRFVDLPTAVQLRIVRCIESALDQTKAAIEP